MRRCHPEFRDSATARDGADRWLTIVYTPNADWTGVDLLSYTVAKANGKTATGQIAIGTVRPGKRTTTLTSVRSVTSLRTTGGR